MAQEVSEQEKKGLEVKVSTLEGSPIAERGKFVQVFEIKLPKDEEFPPERGQLFAVLELMVDPSQDPEVAGKLVWDTLAEEYYAEEDETPVQALERAVYAVREKLQALSANAVLDLGTVAFRGDVVYYARLGHPALYFRRDVEAFDLLQGEEAASIGSQILEEGDVLVLGSPIFAKNFPPESLPRTEFLEKQFAEGEKVPGFAALLLRLSPSREARETAVRKSRASRLVWGKLRQWSASFGGWAKGIPAVLKKPSDLGKRIMTAWEKRVSHGRQLAAERKAAAVIETRDISEPAEESKASALAKKIKWPKIKGLTLRRAIAVLVLILLISVAFTTWQRAQKNRAAEFERLLGVASQNLDEATGLVGLSNERAKELIDEAKASLTTAGSLSSDTSSINQLLARADELFNTIEKITLVTADNLVYDLTLQGEGSNGLALSGAGGTVYALEGTRGAVFAITFPGELAKASALGEGKITGAQEVVAEGGYLYLRGENKLYRINTSKKTVDEPIDFDRITKATALGTYLGNIYLLVPGEEQVYKFWNLTGGYSRAVSWVKEAVPMTEVVDMAIDGEIWLLNSNGTITRLTTGKVEAFAISNLSTASQEPIKIFTHPKLKYLYVLDKGGQRVVVLEKNGNFSRQLKGDVLADLKDLWVSDNEKTLFLLSGNQIYRISL